MSFQLARQLLAELPDRLLQLDKAPQDPGFAPSQVDIGACIDLTSLNSTDTPESIRELCERAREYEKNWGSLPAAVCVYPAFLGLCERELEDTTIQLATVAAAFPHGLTTQDAAVAEVIAAVQAGADEIDIVIPRYLANVGEWHGLYEWVEACRLVCPDHHLKVILATGELNDSITITSAGLVALAAGADFIKTSTGKEAVNATAESVAAMLQALCVFHQATGEMRGLKVAGGVRDYAIALAYARQWQEVTCTPALTPDLFRIGASSLAPPAQG